jgi:putative ABC transport system permease protein
MHGLAFVKDGFFGMRALRRKPALLIVLLGTLATSIGAGTAVFSVVNSLLLRPPPYDGADRLVMIWQKNVERSGQAGADRMPVSYGDFSDLKETNRSFEQLGGLDPWFANLTGIDEPQRLSGVRASADFFSLMRVNAFLGRTLTAEDEQPHADRVVLLSYGLWRARFGGDRNVVGKSISLNDASYIIIGVLPDDFRFTESSSLFASKFSRQTDVWIPLILGDRRNNRDLHNLAVIARLKHDASIEQARAEAKAFAGQMAQQYPQTDASYGMDVISLRDQVAGDVEPVLLLIWAATGLVLLIACANIAILLMARATTRHRELAVRLALGATRSTVVRQLLAESVFLSLSGGLLGVGLACLASPLLGALSPFSVLHNNPVAIDVRVLGFTVGVSILTGLLFGTLPALQSVKSKLTEDLKEGAHGSTRRSRPVLRSLVVVETALTIVLLVGAGLSVKSFIQLLRLDPGFSSEGLVTIDIFLPFSHYKSPSQKVDFFQRAMDKIRSIPYAESVGMNYALPFSGVDPSNTFEIEGRPPLETGRFQSANLGLVDADYFRTLHIPLLQGRSFTVQDTADSQLVAIIDQRMAGRYFPAEDPLGKRITIASKDLLTIVGVVGSIKQDVFEDKSRPYVYVPFQQRSYSFSSFAVRSKTRDSAGLIAAVREEIKAVDKDLPISNVTTLEKSYSDAIAPRRYSMLLLTLFGLVALFLTEMGIYGVMNYAVEQRKREIGIRIALGAQADSVLKLFIKEGMALTLVGLTIGIAASLALVKVMASLIYGISARDLTTFSSISVLTAVVTLFACYLPAKGAARVDPTDVLRAE